MHEPDPNRNDLIAPGGINAGADAAERDRLPDGDISVDELPANGGPSTDADPPDELVGAPGQTDDTPGQQLGLGEG